MHQKRICCPPLSEAVRYAAGYLKELGFEITASADMDAAHLLLPVPSFPAASSFLREALPMLSEDVLISGGNLDGQLPGHRTVDYLKDPYYLAENAAITAECAIEIVKKQFCEPLDSCPILIIGWGRIGKCLGSLLKKAEADVTVAARKDADRAMARALGCRGISIEDASAELMHYRVILNTVPVMVLPDMVTHPEAVILELASKPGMSGANIIDARGLPSKMAPEASGKLIAQTFIRLSLGKEV